jgi:hypothetical protein
MKGWMQAVQAALLEHASHWLVHMVAISFSKVPQQAAHAAVKLNVL